MSDYKIDISVFNLQEFECYNKDSSIIVQRFYNGKHNFYTDNKQIISYIFSYQNYKNIIPDP